MEASALMFYIHGSGSDLGVTQISVVGRGAALDTVLIDDGGVRTSVPLTDIFATESDALAEMAVRVKAEADFQAALLQAVSQTVASGGAVQEVLSVLETPAEALLSAYQPEEAEESTLPSEIPSEGPREPEEDAPHIDYPTV